MMKFYGDPISTTSRPVYLFLSEHDLPVEQKYVNVFAGEHQTDAFAELNPNKAIPVLVDDDLVLTEGSAILKYLAEKAKSSTYPEPIKARARINQAMDWFNTGFYRDFGYGVVYSQTIPGYDYPNAITNEEVRRRANDLAAKWFTILNNHWLDGHPYLTGQSVTIADYLGACYVSVADWVGFDLSRYPNVARWLEAMSARPSWEKTHASWNALVANLTAQRLKSA